MKYISSDDLILIGEGANAQVYKYNQPFCDGIPSAAVKIGQRFNPRYAIEKYEIIKHAGCFTLAFYEECRVDGKPAIIMEDLFTDDKYMFLLIAMADRIVSQKWNWQTIH